MFTWNNRNLALIKSTVIAVPSSFRKLEPMSKLRVRSWVIEVTFSHVFVIVRAGITVWRIGWGMNIWMTQLYPLYFSELMRLLEISRYCVSAHADVCTTTSDRPVVVFYVTHAFTEGCAKPFACCDLRFMTISHASVISVK